MSATWKDISKLQSEEDLQIYAWFLIAETDSAGSRKSCAPGRLYKKGDWYSMAIMPDSIPDTICFNNSTTFNSQRYSSRILAYKPMYVPRIPPEYR